MRTLLRHVLIIPPPHDDISIHQGNYLLELRSRIEETMNDKEFAGLDLSFPSMPEPKDLSPLVRVEAQHGFLTATNESIDRENVGTLELAIGGLLRESNRKYGLEDGFRIRFSDNCLGPKQPDEIVRAFVASELASIGIVIPGPVRLQLAIGTTYSTRVLALQNKYGAAVLQVSPCVLHGKIGATLYQEIRHPLPGCPLKIQDENFFRSGWDFCPKDTARGYKIAKMEF